MNTPSKVSNNYAYFYRYGLVCKKKQEKIVEYLKQLLKENDFEVKEISKNDEIILLLSQTNEERLLREAQYSKIRKVSTRRSSVVIPDICLPDQVVENEKKRNFIYKDRDNFTADVYYDMLYKSKKEDESWGFGLFTENEMLFLEYQILSQIELNPSDFLRAVQGAPLEKKIEDVRKVLDNELSAFHVLSQFKVIKDHFPLHISNFRENLVKETLFTFKTPYRKIRSYFGDKVAIYYAWVYHYTRFLLIPATFSILILLLNTLMPHNTKLLLTVYALIIVIWTQLFVIYWNRKCSEIAVEWDNFTEEYDKTNLRREFKGEWRISPVTNQFELYYPDTKRKIYYVISFLMSLPFLLLGLFVNICFLNLSGSIQPHMNSIFEIEYLAQFSEPGRIFDPNGFLNTVIGIIQVLVILVINGFYRKVAEKSCEMENHRVKSNFENSLIIKRFVFEFFDTFIGLFYLAFVAHDIQGLKSQIQSLFIANEIRRILTETVIPNVIHLFKGSAILKKLFTKGEKDSLKTGKDINEKEVLEQIENEEYETFDDYLEVVLEFGYLTLFAECFPLAPIFIIILNTIELRSDILKLCSVFKRPKYIRKRNIGSWHLILQVIATLSIFTNLLFTVTFTESEGVLGYIKGDAGVGQTKKFFVLEHIVFSCILLLRLSLSSESKWVTLFHQRREHNMKANKWTRLLESSTSKVIN